MKISKMQIAIYLMIAAGFILSMAFYDRLPDSMASHWNAKGQVDGYMSKSVCAFLMPGVMLFMAATFMLIVRIDPLRTNVEKFRSYYEGFIVFMMVFLLIMHIWMLLWNTGIKVSANFIMPLTVGGLYFFLGMILGKIKRNWFIGVRTPWTLSNEVVWRRTHEFSGTLFKVAGLIAMAGALFEQLAIWFVLVPILAVSVIVTVYSYVIYKRVKASGTDADAEGMEADAGSGDSTWDNIKEGYLQQVEKSLMKVPSPRKKEVLEDVACHLDQKFGELADDDRTWENYQQIITEMGPAEDYAELLSPASLEANSKKFSLGKILIIVVVAGLIWLLLPFIAMVGRFAGLDIGQVDNINLPFVDDPEVIGMWKAVDFVDEIEQFKVGEKQWKGRGGELFLHEMIFEKEGKLISKNSKVPRGYPQTWTRGMIIYDNDTKTASHYTIKDIDGSTYIFREWKSGDYTFRHRKPAYYVLKKEPARIDIEPGDLDIRLDSQRNLYNLVVSIHNTNNVSLPRFKLRYYRGNPKHGLDEAGKAHSGWHNAGPIEPGKSWNERTRDFSLADGQYEFHVIIDYDNSVPEINENNNQAVLQVEISNGQIAEKSFSPTGGAKSLRSAVEVSDAEFASGLPAKIEELGLESASLERVKEIFGKPAQYIWGNETFTEDHLPRQYILVYPSKFHIYMRGNRIVELRHESGSSYVFRDKIRSGSTLDEVFEVIGHPEKTVEGQQNMFEDGVLYKDIAGRKGHCYYARSDQNVRLWFLDYKIIAIYMTCKW